MLKRCSSFILMAIVLAACSHHPRVVPMPQPSKPIPPVVITKQFIPETGFTQVDARGRINVNLHTGYKQPKVLLQGDPRDLEQVSIRADHGKLVLIMANSYPRYGAVNADIQSTELNVFRYQGEGYVTGSRLNTRYLELYLNNAGKTQLNGSIGLQVLEVIGEGETQISGLHSGHLKIKLEGRPKVQLAGSVHLSSLDVKGNAWLSLYWLKGSDLSIKMHHTARVQLAGSINRLEVETWGMARFNGRYLRAQRSFVKTHDHSVAEISSVNHQSNLAMDASDIYYYNLPNTRTDFMAEDGSVLDMRNWNNPYLRDFTKYNKQFP